MTDPISLGAPLLDWTRIAPLYQAPGRVYHDMAHIHAMLREIAARAAAGDLTVEEAALLEAATWLHDAFYDPQSPHGENERRSAQLVDIHLPHLPLDHRRLLRTMILATAHHGEDQVGLPPLAHWLLDIDLWEVGADRWTFERNTARVAAEHRLVGRDEGRIVRGRRAWAQALLARRSLYYRPENATRLASARENLESLL